MTTRGEGGMDGTKPRFPAQKALFQHLLIHTTV